MHLNSLLPRVAFLALALFIFSSCDEITRRIAQEAGKANRMNDSLKNVQSDKPIDVERFEVLNTIVKGHDSLFLVRQFYVSGEKYAEAWFMNRNVRDSISTFYYKSGQMSHRLSYRGDTLVDLLESYTPEGQKRDDSKVKNGTGHLRLYHPVTFNLLVDCGLKNGLKQGSYTTWYANGKRQEAGVFEEDMAQSFNEWYQSGVVKTSLQRKPGAPNTFTYTTYYESGKTEMHQVQEDYTHGRSDKFDQRGNITEHIVEKEDEMTNTKSYYGEKNVLTSRGVYVNDKKQGKYEYFYEDGARKTTELYSNDTLVSESKWYNNGQLMQEVGYRNNAYHGWYRDYYPNGNKRTEQEYQEGTKHGQYHSYFENGNKYFEGRFENSKLKGEMKEYTRDGKFRSAKNYN